MLIHLAPTFRGVKNNYALLLKDRDDKQRFDHEKAGVLGCRAGKGPVFPSLPQLFEHSWPKKPLILSLYPFSRSFFGYKESAPYSKKIYSLITELHLPCWVSYFWFCSLKGSFMHCTAASQAEQLYREARAGGSAKLGWGISRRRVVGLGRWMGMEWWAQ